MTSPGARRHLGQEYAALLVTRGYSPPTTMAALPAKGRGVIALATVPGRLASAASAPKIHFSGYDWEPLQIPSDSGGVMHANSASNAWTDQRGWLHLRITRQDDGWACAEIVLSRLGYGSYSFAVRGAPQFEAGTVLGIFTRDPLGAEQNNREMDIELSRWGDPRAKSAQFAIQPYYVPANVYRFNSPSSALTHSFDWQPERVSFQTVGDGRVIAEHAFTSGIPSPGGERLHINLYVFGKSRTPQHRGVEVVIEKFEYLP